MIKLSAETQFSIYKIDFDLLDSVFHIAGERDSVEYIENATKALINGSGARDLTNQILSSSEYLSMHRISYDSETFFEDYYEKIAEKAKNEKRQLTIGKKEFVSRLKSAKIFYVAGYLSNFRRNSDSTYAKYLGIELVRKLKAKGFDLIIAGLG